MTAKQEAILSTTARTLSRAFRWDKEERIARRWRFKSIVFYGSILAELILFAAFGQPSPGGLSSRHSVMQLSNTK